MKQSVHKYKVGNMVKITNRRHSFLNSDGDNRWPENTVCVVTDIFYHNTYISGEEQQVLKLLAIKENDGQIQYEYYADEVSLYPSNADMIARMTDKELSDFLLNWLRSPYGGEIIE